MRVLIVDDAMIMRNMLGKKLKDLGHEVIGEAKNGVEGYEMYKELNPDFITMDIAMPMMNGIECLEKIMMDNADAKVIMITSHGEENKVIESIKLGAKGYVMKPFTNEKLEESIAKITPAE